MRSKRDFAKLFVMLAAFAVLELIVQGLLARKYDFVLVVIICTVWLVISVLSVALSVKFTRNYNGPEFMGVGSGYYWSLATCLIGLSAWGAVEAISSILA